MSDRSIDELGRIWDLKQAGAISDEEYLRLKAGILSPPPNSSSTPKSTAVGKLEQPIKKMSDDNRLSQTSGRPKSNKWTIIGGVLVVFVALAIIGGEKSPTGNAISGPDRVTSDTKAAQGGDADQAATYKSMLKREISSMRDQRVPVVEPTKEAIMAEAILLGARAKAYEDAPSQFDAETRTLRAQYKRLAIQYQSATFPKLRKAQAEVFDRLMWEQNIRVAAVGAGNRILRFTGGLFASNAAIATGHENVGDTLKILRFDQDRYEWYRGSEYTYYKTSSIPDAQFATFDGTSWEPVREPVLGQKDPKCVPALAKRAGLKCD